jgi:hypothetical protein
MEKFTTEIETNVCELLHEISQENNIPYEKLEMSMIKFFDNMKISIENKNPKTTTKNKTKTTIKKEIETEKRCMAKTKDNSRCKASKTINLRENDNENLCATHNRLGIKYGMFCENETFEKQELFPIPEGNETEKEQIELIPEDTDEIEKILKGDIAFV